MSTRFGRQGFDTPYGVRIEHLDYTWIANGNIQVPERGIKEDHVWDAA